MRSAARARRDRPRAFMRGCVGETALSFLAVGSVEPSCTVCRSTTPLGAWKDVGPVRGAPQSERIPATCAGTATRLNPTGRGLACWRTVARPSLRLSSAVRAYCSRSFFRFCANRAFLFASSRRMSGVMSRSRPGVGMTTWRVNRVAPATGSRT